MLDNEQPVGPGNPPKEYRWKKGCPSPNPRGRPPTKKREDMLGRYDEYAETIVKVGNIMRGSGENQMSLWEASYRKLVELGYDPATPPAVRVKVLKMFLDEHKSALKIIEKTKETQFIGALAYTKRWTKPFRSAERRMVPVPEILPHPDDVIIHDDASVSIVGPITPDQQEVLEIRLKQREALTRALLETTNVTDKEGKSVVRFLRRELNKIEKQIPPRLQRIVPSRLPTP